METLLYLGSTRHISSDTVSEFRSLIAAEAPTEDIQASICFKDWFTSRMPFFGLLLILSNTCVSNLMLSPVLQKMHLFYCIDNCIELNISYPPQRHLLIYLSVFVKMI